MSYTRALERAQRLRHHLHEAGIERVSIELVEGRGWRSWNSEHFVASMGHHIVSRRSQGLTPFLWLVKAGRSDLPGPICNGYMGFDRVARIICMGLANHPGRGGPYTVELGTVPANNGRPYFFGWEHEGGISEADWDSDMRRAMGQCHAGTLRWIAEERGHTVTERSHIEHKTWAPSRKSDRLGYTLFEARQELEPYLEGGLPDMFLPISRDEDRRSDVAHIASLCNAAYGDNHPTDGTWSASLVSRLQGIDRNTNGNVVTGQMYTEILVTAMRRAVGQSSGDGSVPEHQHKVLLATTGNPF